MTHPELESWPPSERTYRRSVVSAVVGRGDIVWQRVGHDVLRWRVKTASGFAVDFTRPATRGDRVDVTARLLGMTIVEPVEVMSVVEEPNRIGFAYRTLPGHPVSGEEAFIVHRRGEEILLTIRSLTRAASQQPWRFLYPLLRIAQHVVRKRYLRALR